MPTNDEQAKALVAILAPLLAETLIPQLKEQVEAQIKGVVSKNDELLDKLHSMQKDNDIAALAKTSDAITAQAKKLLDAGNTPKTDKGLTDFRKAGEPVRIGRTDARDVAAYRKAKARASEQGVSLEVVDD